MNLFFPKVTRYTYFKRYVENYDNDLKLFYQDFENATELEFLKNDLSNHKSILKHYKKKSPDGIKDIFEEDKERRNRIYEQKRIIEFIENKIAEIKKSIPKKDEFEKAIDLSTSNAVQKIIFLHELGIIDFLRTKQPFSTSVNSLANVLTAITGEKTTTLQPYLNALLSNTEAENKHPYYSKSTAEKVRNQLINLGFKVD